MVYFYCSSVRQWPSFTRVSLLISARVPKDFQFSFYNICCSSPVQSSPVQSSLLQQFFAYTFTYRTFKTLRDCMCIFKWPSKQRWQCPIHNGTFLKLSLIKDELNDYSRITTVVSLQNLAAQLCCRKTYLNFQD